MTDDDQDPLCDLYGDCEPFPEEMHLDIAMCRFCGGERYKDYPTFGNWGTWEPEVEAILENRRLRRAFREDESSTKAGRAHQS